MDAPRVLELLPEQAAKLQLPAHVGGGVPTIQRTRQRASLFDVVVKMHTLINSINGINMV